VVPDPHLPPAVIGPQREEHPARFRVFADVRERFLDDAHQRDLLAIVKIIRRHVHRNRRLHARKQPPLPDPPGHLRGERPVPLRRLPEVENRLPQMPVDLRRHGARILHFAVLEAHVQVKQHLRNPVMQLPGEPFPLFKHRPRRPFFRQTPVRPLDSAEQERRHGERHRQAEQRDVQIPPLHRQMTEHPFTVADVFEPADDEGREQHREPFQRPQRHGISPVSDPMGIPVHRYGRPTGISSRRCTGGCPLILIVKGSRRSVQPGGDLPDNGSTACAIHLKKRGMPEYDGGRNQYALEVSGLIIHEAKEGTYQGERAIVLKYGAYSAILLPRLGGNLVAFRDDEKGWRFLREPSEEEFADFAKSPKVHGIPVLVPPNRYDGGRFAWNGRQYEFPVNEPETGNHLHGFAADTEWTVTGFGSDESKSWVQVKLAFDETHPFHRHFPHKFSLTLTYVLS